MNLLRVNDVTKKFRVNNHSFLAIDHVSFHVNSGEIVGLVGGSGSGKSTLARMIMGFTDITSGNILLDGVDTAKLSDREKYEKIQMVFQNPLESFNPRRRLEKSIIESQIHFGIKPIAPMNLSSLMELVGLQAGYAKRFPHEISGGECQRAAIARALAIHPQMIICDEITSSLDVSVQAQIIELIRKLRDQNNMSFLFISHDLSIVNILCDRVIVMNKGKIVEEGNGKDIISNPKHSYTKQLLDAVFPIDRYL